MVANQVGDVAEAGPWLNAVARFRTTKILGIFWGATPIFPGDTWSGLGRVRCFFLTLIFLGVLGCGAFLGPVLIHFLADWSSNLNQFLGLI